MAVARMRRKAARPKFTPSRGLVDATYRLLMADKSMVGLLLAGGFASAATLALIMFPAWFFGHITPSLTGSGLLGLLVLTSALWASSFVMQMVTGAVVAAAMIRADGGAPSVRTALAVAWSRRWQLAAWALVSTIVEVLLSKLQRFGMAGIAARHVAGIGWAAATIFAVPLVISQGTMPGATLRRSATMARENLGAAVRSQVRLAAPWIAGMIAALLVTMSGIIALAVGVNDRQAAAALIGAALAGAGGVAFFFTAVTSAALSAYLDTMLFRYATGQFIPGINPADLPLLSAAT
jgi:Family of unknown function (DUF6159)